MIKSIDVSVLKDAKGYDCTNNGVTSKKKDFILLALSAPGQAEEGRPDFEEIDAYIVKNNIDCDNVLILNRFSYHGAEPYVRCYPYHAYKAGTWCMAGGNFVYSCDSRFRQYMNPYPISVHDRIESNSNLGD